jgi:hypothetical protein
LNQVESRWGILNQVESRWGKPKQSNAYLCSPISALQYTFVVFTIHFCSFYNTQQELLKSDLEQYNSRYPKKDLKIRKIFLYKTI